MTNVGQTFHQHEILITGANGFLGKVVLGLLLDHFPEFKHLHILIRPGRNLSAEERFYSDTLVSPSLAAIAKMRGQDFLRQKITTWQGDISQPNCGIASAGLERMAGHVDVIVNCAGRVEFFPPIDDSFSSNVDGVEHVVGVARLLGAKLLHVSTCFVCGEADGLVEETEPVPGYYPRRKGPDDHSFDHREEIRYCRELVRQIDEPAGSDGRPGARRRSKEVAQRLIALGKQRAENWGWPNTYTFSKSLGEQIIAAEKDLDYTIVRPAIIESALRFPFPGWIEGGRTAAPLVLMALGGLKEWPFRKDAPLEVVPVDLVASAVLTVTSLLLEGHHAPVYQLGTADVNPILLEKIVTLVVGETSRLPQKPRKRAPGLALISPPKRVRFISAEEVRTQRVRLQKRIDRTQALISGMRKVLEKTGLPGKKSLATWTRTLRTMSLRAAFHEQTMEQYLPFVFHNRYIFESENIRAAYSRLSEKDKQLLPWDPERIEWDNYWINHQVRGILKWVQPEAVREWAFQL